MKKHGEEEMKIKSKGKFWIKKIASFKNYTIKSVISITFIKLRKLNKQNA